MIKILYVATVFLLICLLSCNKENESNQIPEEIVNVDSTEIVDYFKFEIGDDFLQNHSLYVNNKWVVFYDLDNRLLAYQKLIDNEVYLFESLKENCHVQIIDILSHQNNYPSTTIRVDTYLDVEPNIWKFGKFENSLNKIGDIVIDVTDIPYNLGYDISTKSCVFNLEINGSQFKLAQYYEPDQLWFKIDNANQPKYIWYENVPLNSEYSIGIDDLLNMNFLEVELPEFEMASLSLYGIGNEFLCLNNYNIYNCSYNGFDQSSVGVYYPEDIFNKYLSNYWIQNDRVFQQFTSCKSSIPRTFESSDLSSVVLQDDILDFQSSLLGSADYFKIGWKNIREDQNEYVYYNVYGDAMEEISFTAPEIPVEILNGFSDMLDFNMMAFEHISFFDYSATNNLNDFIYKTFVERENPIYDGSLTKEAFFGPNFSKQDNIKHLTNVECDDCSN